MKRFFLAAFVFAGMGLYAQQVTLNQVTTHNKSYAILTTAAKLYPYNSNYIKSLGSTIDKAPVIHRNNKADEIIYNYTAYMVQDGVLAVVQVRMRLFNFETGVEFFDDDSSTFIGIDEHGEYFERTFLICDEAETVLEVFQEAYSDIGYLL